MRVSLALGLALLALLAASVVVNADNEDLSSSADDAAGAGAAEAALAGVTLQLPAHVPKLVIRGGADCQDGTAACAGSWLVVNWAKLYELDGTGNRVSERKGLDVLADLSAASWSVVNQTLGTPPVTVTRAELAMPVRPAGTLPACPGGAPPAPSAGGSVTLAILLFNGDTNLTINGGAETVEVLRGNVKFNIEAQGWPFCSSDNSLAVQLGLRSSSFAARPPKVEDGEDVEAAGDEVETLLEASAGYDPSTVASSSSAPGATRRLLERGGNGRGAGDGEPGHQGAYGTNSSSALDMEERQAHRERRDAGQLISRLAPKLNATAQNIAEQRLKGRPVLGLGARGNTERTFLALAAGAGVDAKLDVPALAYLNNGSGWEVVPIAVDVDTPAAASSAGLIRLTLAFPMFQQLQYDPTSAFATADDAADASLAAELGGATSGAGARAAPAALLLGAAAALALLG
eukprot:scaffold10.g2423.t1